ncbi:MAG: flippase [Acidobacteria bacterium]|nr:flippase [Acidobacteriota bacterium]
MNRISFNAGARLTAEIVGRLLSFALAYVAQRRLGPEVYGQFTVALALGYVLTPAADLGLQLTATRAIARDRTAAPRIAGEALAMKAPLALAVLIVLALASAARPEGLALATLTVGAGLVLASFVEFAGYIFRGLQRLEYDALASLFLRALTAATGIWALMNGFGLLGLGLAHLFGAIVAIVFTYALLTRFFRISATFDRDRSARRLGEALPLGAAIVVSIAYTRIPVFFLDALRDPGEVGLYGVAAKLTEPLAIIPASLLAAIFPAFTERLASREGSAGRLGSRSTMLLAGIGVVLGIAGVIGGPTLIHLLYGSQYAGAEQPLQILSLTFVFTFVNYALTHFLVALGRQRLNLWFAVATFGANVVVSMTLIPRFGVPGAAAAVLVSEAFLFGLCAWALGCRKNLV